MTLEKAGGLIAIHSSLGSGFKQNAARKVSREVMRDHGQETVDTLIRTYDHEIQWETKPGTELVSAFKS